MCINCTATKKKYWVFGCSAFFLLAALIVGLLWPQLAVRILQSELQLKNGTLNYNNWIETPIPMYLKIKLFNWTNPEHISNPNIKPNFTECGPYVFLEKHKRVDVVWHPENNTVSYNQIRTWHFVPELSNGHLDDKITSINVMMSSVAFAIRHQNYLIRKLVNELILKSRGGLTVTKTVREWCFDGYDDPLLDLIKVLHLPQFKIPFSKFGWFVERNNSKTFDGRFEIFTGQDDITKLGMLTNWNGKKTSGYYYDDCSKVMGTTGEIWPVGINPTGNITVFVTDICRPITLNYQQPHDKFGLVGSRWIGDYRVFDNGQLYPPNSCYCTGLRSSCPDVLTGVHNASDCRFGAPVFASFPHFYLADKSYVNAVTGLKPNQSLHEFSISLEPKTGIPLSVAAKLQINILLQPITGITVFSKVPKIMIPTFWFEQTVELDERLAKEAKMALGLPYIGTYAAYGFFGLGFILVLVGIVATITKSWTHYDNLDDELTS